MVFQLSDTKKAAPLFKDWQETLIWSCLQKVMGEIYADDLENPQSAMAVLGDFCFFAGKPNDELVTYHPHDHQPCFLIMVPQNEAWAKRIVDEYGTRAKKVIRYAFKKEGNLFDTSKLRAAISTLPPQFSLKMIDEEMFHWCKSHTWSKDFVSQYEDFTAYQKLGIGVVAIKDGIPISGASSYSSYHGGIEIEIDTKEEFRRMGLAYACGAKLILACMERNLYPSWDAQNRWSAALAEKLGYRYDYDYVAYEISEE